MDWLSLIPTALSALGGLFGGGQKTTTTTPTLSPQMQQLVNQAMTKAGQVFNQPYKAYTGQRVAGPTASRTALNPVMAQIGQQTQAGMSDANGFQDRIRQLLNRGPARITAPTLVPGGPQVGTAAQSGVTALPPPAV